MSVDLRVERLVLPDLGLSPGALERVKALVEEELAARLDGLDAENLPAPERIERSLAAQLRRAPGEDPERLAEVVATAVARALGGGGS